MFPLNSAVFFLQFGNRNIDIFFCSCLFIKAQLFLSRLNGPPVGLTAAGYVIIDSSFLLAVNEKYHSF